MVSQAGEVWAAVAQVFTRHPPPAFPSYLGGGVHQHSGSGAQWQSQGPRPLDERHLHGESDPVLTSGPRDRQGQTGTPRRPFSHQGECGGDVSIYPWTQSLPGLPVAIKDN